MRKRYVLRRQAEARLLDADGDPIEGAGTLIPFIQWEPNGNPVGRTIDRGPVVAAQAKQFMAKGGRYAYVIRLGGEAELVAGFPLDDGQKGEMAVVAEEIIQDGPEIGPAIDRLVANSVANMDRFTVVPETLQ